MGRPEVVVVTGASAGVGRATVRKLAQAGAHIGLIARGREGLEGARREVEELGGLALVLPADVSRFEEVERAADLVERELGPIDIWINCASVTIYSPIAELRPEEARRVIEVAYLGYVHGTLAALSRMLPRDRGKIVQVSSSLAFRGIPLQAPYCAAKAAIRGFTESLIAELLHDGSKISVSMVHLPALDTPQFDWSAARIDRQPQPVPPIFEPEIAADAIVWAAHHDRRDLTVTASAKKLIALNKTVPGLVDRYLGEYGYEMQQSDRPRDPSQPNNLFEPVPIDAGAHGSYGARAKKRSTLLWMDTHRGTVVAVCALLGIAALATRRALSRRVEEQRAEITRTSASSP